MVSLLLLLPHRTSSYLNDMTISKEHITISRVGAMLGLVTGLITIIGAVILIGVSWGNIQTVNAEQTKQIDTLNVEIRGVATKDDLKIFKEDIKGLLQTYTSQLSRSR